MKIKKNGKVIILTESDLRRITKKVLREQGLPKVDKDTYELGKKLFNKAKSGDTTSLELLSQMIQVIRWAGIWRVHEKNLFFTKVRANDSNVLCAAFVDQEQPGIGGNPWLSKKGGCE